MDRINGGYFADMVITVKERKAPNHEMMHLLRLLRKTRRNPEYKSVEEALPMPGTRGVKMSPWNRF